MEFRETAAIVCREVYSDSIRKDILALLNGNGGVIYLGVDSAGEIKGLENPDLVILRTANECYDAIRPEITGMLHYSRITVEDSTVLKLTVERGSSKPYFLSDIGIIPEGVYIRKSVFTVPTSEEQILAMIRETDGDAFEGQRSLRQDLTFEQASAEFSLKDLILDEAEMRSLKMMNREGLYTNLALLLSDQCSSKIKTAIFRNDETTLLQQTRIFGGSVLQQLREVEEYLELSNLSAVDKKGLPVRDRREYPPEAVREGLSNALLHREYSIDQDIQINVFENRLEVISCGGLVGAVTLEDVKLGLSVCRNPLLASVFVRLQLAQAVGSGIRRIQKSYGQPGRKPVFYASANVFKVLLPNQNESVPAQAERRENSAGMPVNSGAADAGETGRTDERANAILQYLQENETASRNELQQVAGVSPAGTVRLLRRLCDARQVEALGRGKCTRYRLGINQAVHD